MQQEDVNGTPFVLCCIPVLIITDVMRLLTLKLTNAINSMDVAWETITPADMAPTITKRYSHSACYHGLFNVDCFA